LFDSRDIGSRTVVKSLQKQSTCKLDISKLFRGAEQDNQTHAAIARTKNPIRFGFLKELNRAVESVGGVWARLADLPFPYQGIGCLNGEAKTPSQAQPERIDRIQKRYIAGLPSNISTADLSDLANLSPESGLQSPGLPLLWRVDQADFAKWWRHRNRLEIRLWQSPTHYRVECRPVHSKFCPVLEIWRGNHLAGIPLRAESVIVRKDGLVFLRQPKRNPAGFTAGWPDGPTEELDPRISA
jgi:hypothetical protein